MQYSQRLPLQTERLKKIYHLYKSFYILNRDNIYILLVHNFII